MFWVLAPLPKPDDDGVPPVPPPRGARRRTALLLFWLGLAMAAAGLVHYGFGARRAALIVYAVSAGLLLLCAALLFRQRKPRDTVLRRRTLEDVEEQVEILQEQNRQLRATCQELRAAAREQQGRMADLSVGQKVLAASAEEADADALHERVLSALMEAFGAGGAALWLRSAAGDRMEARAVVGQVAPILRDEPVPTAPDSQPSDIRRACEERLQAAAPHPRPLSRPRSGESERKAGGEGTGVREEGTDLLSALLREGDNLLGVIAFCGASGGRFSPEVSTRLAALAPTITLAVVNVEQRARLRRNVREMSILHEMSNLVQTATDPDELYSAVVDLVGRVVSYENCTVFILDAQEKRLIPRATRGRVVNLIDHIPFAHGSGISGWVAQQRKQLFIPDLTKEPGLLNVELIPPRVRSFLSVPMVVQENLIGVLNVSHSRPYAFSPEDARVLSILAGQAAVTLERGQVLRSLEEMAITDGLTRLYNHRYFDMRLDHELKRARRYNLPASLLMIDLDHFKQVNDRHGHATGDGVLSETGALLRRSVRETDIVARYGGEEIAVLLTQTALQDALITAERVRSVVAEYAFRSTDGAPLSLTVSIGVAGFPAHAADAEALLKEADAALYAAKEGGRNRVCSAPSEED
jgi:diguanylate cyclase (GGDEF)-like protein